MYVIEIVPLTLLPINVPQVLSYFFNFELRKGAVVEIPLNNRKVKAVVVSSNSLEKEKLTLKKSNFQIKKLTRVLYANPQVSDYQLKLATWIAKYYYAPLGYTLKTILPVFAFKKKYQLHSPIPNNTVIPVPTLNVGNPLHTFSANLNTSGKATIAEKVRNPQLLIYKTKGLVECLGSVINKTVKRTNPSSLKSYSEARQVLILVPEKSSINYFFDYFSKTHSTTVIYSGLSNEKLYEAWNNTHTGKVNIIIGTRQALNMHFKNLGLIIVDDPLHEFYKSDMMPRYNAVALAHKVAELNNSQLILTSVTPGVENYYKAKNNIYELKNIESRPTFEVEIIDIAQEVKNANWSPISKKLKEELIAHLRNNKKILIFSPRRGYAGILVCENCGSAVKCPQCEAAMRTHRSVEMILVCHHCGISKPMPANCLVCGNHNLKTIGPAGTQKIYDYIRTLLTSADIKSPLLALDTDIVKNEVEEEEIISEISRSKSSVLIATQMIFSHRFNLNFDLIAIVNADALMNMPDFKSEENLFYQMEKLVNFKPKKLIIQTYNPGNKIIEKAACGDCTGFYENELKLREALNYPPFYQLIKLAFRHKNKMKAAFAARITTEKLKIAIARKRLEEVVNIIEATPAYIERERNLYTYNIFLKVRRGEGSMQSRVYAENYQDIDELLKYIGPSWIIDVDPRSLL